MTFTNLWMLRVEFVKNIDLENIFLSLSKHKHVCIDEDMNFTAGNA